MFSNGVGSSSSVSLMLELGFVDPFTCPFVFGAEGARVDGLGVSDICIACLLKVFFDVQCRNPELDFC